MEMSVKDFNYGAEILPYHDYSLEESIEELAKLGFKSVNLWSARAPLAHHFGPDEDPEKIKSLLDRHGMKANGLTIYCLPHDELQKRIEFAGKLGVDTVIFDCEANLSEFTSSFLPPLLDTAEKNGVRIAVENHLTVKFTEDFESGGSANAADSWDEGVQSLDDIKRLITDLNHPNLGVCLAPPHLWAAGETITEVINFLAERKKLFYYYIWDVNSNYRRETDGLNFGTGEQQLPKKDGTLDHKLLLRVLKNVGYEGVVSLKCHGTHGWSKEKITNELRKSNEYVQWCMNNV
jgi:sugar phosphate isomerase/epimerase